MRFTPMYPIYSPGAAWRETQRKTRVMEAWRSLGKGALPYLLGVGVWVGIIACMVVGSELFGVGR